MYLFVQYSITYNDFLLIGTCPLNNITSDFSGESFIPNCYIVLHKMYNLQIYHKEYQYRKPWFNH